jgi:hypothetical protein
VTAGLGEVTVPDGFGHSAATDPPAAVVKRPAPPQPAPTRENAVAESRPSPPTQVRRARTKAPPPGKGSPPRGRSSTAASVPARTRQNASRARCPGAQPVQAVSATGGASRKRFHGHGWRR